MTDSDELQSRNFEQEEILQDVVYQSNVKSEFKKLLLRKHLDNPNLANSPLTKWVDEFSQLNPDDIVCVICSDGDYEDDDLIVYCSVFFVYLGLSVDCASKLLRYYDLTSWGLAL